MLSQVAVRRSARPGSFESLESRCLLAASGLLISEFMASNQSTKDAFQQTSDWIEVWNKSAEQISLKNWRLTDDPGELSKWAFPPNAFLQPDERLVVRASGRNTDYQGELHTNFGLKASGEYLALVNPAGNVVSAFGSATSPYPPQRDDVSFGIHRQAMEWVSGVSSVTYLIPTAASELLGTSWTEPDFDDSAWVREFAGGPATASFGYELAPRELVNYTTAFATELPSNTNTFWTRIRFDASSPAEIESLMLRLKFDDGFVAYLNGALVAQANAPADLSWNSTSTRAHADSSAIEFAEFDVTEFLSGLRQGQNVLAIQGLNQPNSSDMLLVPELVAWQTVLDQPRYLIEPTPGTPNGTGVEAFVQQPTISIPHGFYAAEFEVHIASATPGATLVYTLDGSVPSSTNGFRVNSAGEATARSSLAVTTTTILRVMAFRADWQPSTVETRTYIFLRDVIRQDGAGLPDTWGHAGADYEMDPDVVDNARYRDTIVDDLKAIPTVSLVTELENWFGENGVGIYPQGQGSPRPVSVELLQGDGTPGFQVDGSVEIQGGSSTNRWKSDKLSMQLKFKREYGDAKLRYPLFGDGAADEFDTLILDARLNQAWHYGGTSAPASQRSLAQYTRDQFVADLQRSVGGQAPAGHWIHLYLNGIYWGMYNLHERPDEHFAAAYLGGSAEDYDVIKHNDVVVHGSFGNYQRLHAATKRDLTVAANYHDVEALLDLDDFISYMLVNYYVGNDDWAHHNWYATFNRLAGGKWRFHSWDAEHTLKGLRDDVTGRDDPLGPTGIHRRLMANPEYRGRFADAVQRLFFTDGLLTPARAEAAYQLRLDEVEAAVVAESARWGDNQRSRPYTRDSEWVAERDRLLEEYFPARSSIVVQQLRNRGFFHRYDAPTFNPHGGDVPLDFEVLIATSRGEVFYTTDGSDPQRSITAIEYAQVPIAITEPTRVRMRSVESGAWSALVEAIFTPRQTGDFNEDGELNSGDLDLLFASWRTNGEIRFDLTGDQQVDRLDVVHWLEEIAHTRWGDANLDRRIDFADFLLLSNNFGRADAAWTDGDFDGDREVTFADFLAMSANFGFGAE